MKILSSTATLEKYGITEPCEEILLGKSEICDGIVSIDFKCVKYPYDFCRMFTRDSAVQVTLDTGKTEKYLGQYCFNPFWARSVFGDDLSAEVKEMQYLLTKSTDKYVFVLPISNDKFNTTIKADGDNIKLCVNLLYSGAEFISGDIAVIVKDTNPYAAVKNGFKKAYDKGLIKTPPKDIKKYPEVLNKLGWCSWNAFYHDVTEEKLIAKLDEFKAKDIPVKWILIDDGWSEFADMKLKSIYEDRTKFPNGLKHTIERIKSEYGIEAVGVWHSLTGYWYGTDFNDDSIIQARYDRFIPKGYDFYSKWHTYLKEQGVDFVKVDCQGNTVEFLKNKEDALGTISEIFDGLEQSAKESFDFMINCMGMNNINSLNHKSSVLLRSSDDFYPKKEDGFYNHALDNIYNSVFYNELFYCDFDMWWSKHFGAKQNAVLRFMSGGPVYMSDEVNGSDSEYIKIFTDIDGSFMRPQNALRTTYDWLFGFDKILKAFNKVDDGYIITAFSFSESGTATLSQSDIGIKCDTEVTELFSNEVFTLKNDEKVDIIMDKNDVKLYKLCPKLK